MRTRLFIPAVMLCLLLAACSSKPAGPEPATERYPLKGKVVSVAKEEKQIVIQHEEIPNYMKAMTMGFEVGQNTWALDAAKPGMTINAMLVVKGSDAHLEEISLVDQQSNGNAPKVQSSTEPNPGDQVPNFTLVNQEGKKISLDQFQGKPLVVTFIYTRCPVPDYCILMSSNMSKLDAALRSDPKKYNDARLLTVSFDPDADTPKVMKEYGERYLGKKAPDAFRFSTFATGSKEEVQKITSYFGLSYFPENGQIMHGLRTAIIGPDGKLVELIRGNGWKPEQVLTKLEGMKS